MPPKLTVTIDAFSGLPNPVIEFTGSYTDFCTFMVVKHGHFKLKGPY